SFALRKSSNCDTLLRLVGVGGEPPPPALEHRELVLRCAGRKRRVAFARRSHLVGSGNDPLQGFPPELGRALSEARTHKDREWHTVFLEYRQGVVEIVAIPVVEGHRDAAMTLSATTAAQQFVDRNEAPPS